MPEVTNGRGSQVVSVTLVYRDACSRTWCFKLFSEYAPVQSSNALCHDCSSFGYLIGNYPMGWLLQHYHSGRVFGTLLGCLAKCISEGARVSNYVAGQGREHYHIFDFLHCHGFHDVELLDLNA